jgi:hypothetical protein
MMKTEKQRIPRPPRALAGAEVLVIFVLEASAPEMDDDVLDEAFQELVSGFTDRGIWFGSWKILRVADVKLPNASAERLTVLAPLVEELRHWDKEQLKPSSLRVLGIKKVAKINGFGFVLHAPAD